MTKSIPHFTIQQMLEAGVHFGHKTSRWNPQMAPFIYGERNGVHIIDLQKTAPLFHNALKLVYEVAKNNGKIMFVGTKKQAADIVKEAALRCGQYYVNKRWLGGMMTNWNTVSKSIKTMEDLEKILEEAEKNDNHKYNKKELLEFDRKRTKLELSIGGIRKIHGRPDLLFVIDSRKECIAIKEANKLGIPVIAIVDTNSRPEGVDCIVPGNDDASRSISFYCEMVSNTILNAIEQSLTASGVEFGDKESVSAPIKKSVKVEPKVEKEVSAEQPIVEKKAPAKKAVTVKVEEKVEIEKKAPVKKVDTKPAAKKVAEKKPVAKKVDAAKAATKTEEKTEKKAPAKKAAAKKDESK